MRTVAVVAVSVLVLAGSVAAAEARGFRLRGGSFSVPARNMPIRDAAARRASPVFAVGSIGGLGNGRPSDLYRRPGTTVVTRSVMTAEAQVSGPEAGATETSPTSDPAESVAAKKHVAPWCPSGRIAGQGSGFCLIN